MLNKLWKDVKTCITVGTNTNLKKNEINVVSKILDYVTPILAFVNVHLK